MNALQNLWYRLQTAIGRGLVKIVNDSGPVQYAQVDLGPDQLTDQVWMVQNFGFSSNPPVDSEVIVAAIGGDRTQAFGVASMHRATRPRGLAPGDVIVYDTRGQYVRMTATGMQIFTNGLPLTMTAPLVQINGALKVSGDITDNSGSNTATVKQARTAHNLHKHPPSSTDLPDHLIT